MGTISKKIVILCLLIFNSVCIEAQIQRKFFSFNLGKTTRHEIINYYKVRNQKIWYSKDTSISVSQVNFGGHTWPVVYFSFHKDKLYHVYFSDSEGFTPIESLDLLWKRLTSTLSSKYDSYYDEYESTYNVKEFNDNRTKAILKYEYFEGSKGIILMYIDTSLQREKIISENDEL